MDIKVVAFIIVYLIIGYILSISFYAKVKSRENIISMTIAFMFTWVIGVLYILLTVPHTLARNKELSKTKGEKS